MGAPKIVPWKRRSNKLSEAQTKKNSIVKNHSQKQVEAGFKGSGRGQRVPRGNENGLK